MKKNGGYLVRYALEQIGVKFTFGIPGVHNTEIYDELNNSGKITPVLVTHEGGGAFMADAVSRVSDSIGTLVIVPAAGTTHAMSGIGEAFLDGIPMLIISGGTRRDNGKQYQLHQLDQEVLVKGITKGFFLVNSHQQIIPIIYEAYKLATSGEPGPVFVEIPAELLLLQGNIEGLPPYRPLQAQVSIDHREISQAVSLLLKAQNPGIYVGWGAVDAAKYTQQIAEYLAAPVATTLQGLSAFPANHPLHTGMGFGASAIPAAQKAFENCDCLLAVGVRFAELATGSYGMNIPENLIHIDINPAVFHQNYPAKITIEGDSQEALKLIYETLATTPPSAKDTPKYTQLAKQIREEKATYFHSWTQKPSTEKVSPGFFFQALRKTLPDDGIVVVDDGKHTFLTAELFPIHHPRHFISPSDFNCMGYCVPAAIGAKLSHPDKMVAAIVGDGAFMMTGMELVTATSYQAGVMIFVFNDGELGQISQLQKIPLNRKTCTILGKLDVEGVAIATGAQFFSMENDAQIDTIISEAINISNSGIPVIVDVRIDYSRKTAFTKGVVKTNLGRFPMNEKLRFLTRALKRHVLG